jgi:hypothetical protein
VTDSRLAAEQAEALLVPTPIRQAGAVEVSVLRPLTATPRVTEMLTEVLVPVVSIPEVVTVGAPTVKVQIKWPDNTWHTLRPKG